MDTLTKERRSWNMSKVKNTNTGLELLFRKSLYSKGLRYRVNNKVYGKPDIVVNKSKIAIFVDGCFWHQHKKCNLAYIPKSNIKFWTEKFERNQERDSKVSKYLRENGWKVIRVWECQIKNNFEKTLENVIRLTKRYDKNDT